MHRARRPGRVQRLLGARLRVSGRLHGARWTQLPRPLATGQARRAGRGAQEPLDIPRRVAGRAKGAQRRVGERVRPALRRALEGRLPGRLRHRDLLRRRCGARPTTVCLLVRVPLPLRLARVCVPPPQAPHAPLFSHPHAPLRPSFCTLVPPSHIPSSFVCPLPAFPFPESACPHPFPFCLSLTAPYLPDSHTAVCLSLTPPPFCWSHTPPLHLPAPNTSALPIPSHFSCRHVPPSPVR